MGRTPDIDLLERDAALARIGDALERARDGHGSALLVEGPAGIGKTAVLARARNMAAGATTVLSARPTSLEQGFAFGVARRLMEEPLRAADGARRARLLDGDARRAGAVLGLGPAGGGGPGSDFLTLDALYLVLATLSRERPLTLIVDDAHWADPDSLRLVAHLLPRLEGMACTLILAARPGEWRSPVAFDGTASDATAITLELQPLSPAAATEVIARRLGATPDDAFAEACRTATGGNPFYLEALLESLARGGVAPHARNAERVEGLTPRRVVRTTVARLALLAPEASRVAEAAAILDEDADPARLAALAEISRDDARAACGLLEDAAILRPGPPARFVHPIVGNAVYEGIGAPRRTLLHRRAAALLRDARAPVERIASQLLPAEPAGDHDTVRTLIAAADGALGRGATDAAVSLLRRAVAEPPPSSLAAEALARLGFAEMMVDMDAAAEHLTRALELPGAPGQRAGIAETLARVLIFAGRGLEAMRVARRAIDELPGPPGPRRRALEAMVFAVGKTDPAATDARRALVAELRGRADLTASDAGALALRAGVAWVDANACRAREPAVAAVRGALRDGDGALVEHDNGGADFIAAVMVLAMADSDLALPVLQDGTDRAARRGDLFAWAADRIFTCLVLTLRGHPRAAAAAGEEGLSAAERCRIAVAGTWGGGYLATAHLEAGDPAAAERAIRRAEPPDGVPETFIAVPFVDARARVRLAAGDARGALDDSLWCGRVFDSLDVTNPALVPWRSRAALCHHALGEADRAGELAAREVDLARRWGAARPLGVALRAQGLVTGGDDGLATLREAVEVLDDAPAGVERARARMDLGAALRRAGNGREARRHLAAAMHQAWTAGARGVARTARAELRAAGARPRRMAGSGPDALTAGERRVARLAADGLTNAQAAARLHLSPKTIETHLGHAYRKLGIRSRDGLRAALEPASERAGDDETSG